MFNVKRAGQRTSFAGPTRSPASRSTWSNRAGQCHGTARQQACAHSCVLDCICRVPALSLAVKQADPQSASVAKAIGVDSITSSRYRRRSSPRYRLRGRRRFGAGVRACRTSPGAQCSSTSDRPSPGSAKHCVCRRYGHDPLAGTCCARLFSERLRLSVRPRSG